MMYRTLAKWLLVFAVVVTLLPGTLTAQETAPPEDAGTLAPGTVVDTTALDAAYTSSPNYDSGWIAVAQDESVTLTHNLGGTLNHYVVDMQYHSPDVNGINQRYYGGADFGTNPAPGANPEDRVAAYWRSLTTSTITVYRRLEDGFASRVRIRIWDYTPGVYLPFIVR